MYLQRTTETPDYPRDNRGFLRCKRLTAQLPKLFLVYEDLEEQLPRHRALDCGYELPCLFFGFARVVLIKVTVENLPLTIVISPHTKCVRLRSTVAFKVGGVIFRRVVRRHFCPFLYIRIGSLTSRLTMLASTFILPRRADEYPSDLRFCLSQA